MAVRLIWELLDGRGLADWNYSLVRGDAYGGASAGTTLAMSPNDLIENAVLGYNFTAAGLAAAKLTA